VRAGQFGRVVVEDARLTKARAIVMSIPPKSGSGSIYRSIDTVMAERPCRVIRPSAPESRTARQRAETRS
jgi:APA family basic amino acid/polyamine antiporter